jgi:hypothetical protein
MLGKIIKKSITMLILLYIFVIVLEWTIILQNHFIVPEGYYEFTKVQEPPEITYHGVQRVQP